MDVSIGSLAAVPALSRPGLLAAPVASALAALGEAVAGEVGVAEIDPAAADTAAFCERYGVSPAESANCVARCPGLAPGICGVLPVTLNTASNRVSAGSRRAMACE